MKEFSEYKSLEEIEPDMAVDLVRRGLMKYTQEGKKIFPRLPSQKKIGRFMEGIVKAITEAPMGKVKSNVLSRMVRSDNFPDEYKIAIRRLIEDRKIREEKLVTGDIGRPCVYYYLWEF